MLARTPAALKKRRQRARWRNGSIVLPVEVCEHELAEALVLAGRLTGEQALSRAELKRATQAVVHAWCQRWLKP
jgi:hypothetical protein